MRRRRRMLSESDNGVAAFVEDIPALIVVIVAMGAFTAACIGGYSSWVSARADSAMTERAYEFLYEVRSCGALVHNGNSGVFDAQRLMTVNETFIRDVYNVSVLSFNYRITVLDVSGYDAGKCYNRMFTGRDDIYGAADPVSRYSAGTSIVIWVDETEIHAAQLYVSLWRMDDAV